MAGLDPAIHAISKSPFYISAVMNIDDEIELRPARGEDFDAVANVWFESASGLDGAIAEMPSREELRLRVDQGLADGWLLHVALPDNQVVGMLALKPVVTTLDQLFVRPSDQGRGIGRALLNLAKNIMPDGFTLRTATSNAQGRGFYESQGLFLSEEGVHPRTGAPVCFYKWDSRNVS